VSIRLRHAYFDDAGAAHTLSQARFERVMDRHTREPIPELAGKRVRFITLSVLFEDGVALEVGRVDSSLVVFDDNGRRDEADADRQLHAAVELLDDVVGRSDSSTVVPAAARFQVAGFRWKARSPQRKPTATPKMARLSTKMASCTTPRTAGELRCAVRWWTNAVSTTSPTSPSLRCSRP